MEDLSLRAQLHRALDPIAPPAPWLEDEILTWLRTKRSQAARTRARRRPVLDLRPGTLRLIAALAIVVIAVAATATFLSIYHYVHAPIPLHTHPGRVSRMCASDGVYVPGKKGTPPVLKTFAPPGIQGEVKGAGATCAGDANHVWVAASIGTTSYEPDHLVVLSTADGGQTWQQSGPIAFGAKSPSWRTSFSNAVMDFIDSLNGWLVDDIGDTSTNKYARVVYATSDGGITWTKIASSSDAASGALATTALGCVEQGLTFTTQKVGFITWNCAPAPSAPSVRGPLMAMTRDGGRTWQQVTVAASSTGPCNVTAPVFTDQDGMLEATCPDFSLYRTADGGATWTADSLPAPSIAGVEVLDGNTAVYIAADPIDTRTVSNDLYKTTDGGRKWQKVHANLFPGKSISGYQFVDAQTASLDVDGSPAPWWTYDGGKTWALPAPYRSIGDTFCPLPPESPSSVTPIKMVSPTEGWAAGVLKTSDGGSTWRSVAPPSAANRSVGYGEFYLDATHAWVGEAVGSAMACADQVVLYSTSDGGATWSKSTVKPILDRDLAKAGDWNVGLDFIDPTHGWLFVQEIRRCSLGCSTLMPGSIYSTSDAGQTWFLVTTSLTSADGCPGFMPTFTSLLVGWSRPGCSIAADDAAVHFLVTRDGGFTWSRMTMPPNVYCCTANMPAFFDLTHGWFFMQDALLLTSDAGVSWHPASLPHFPQFVCQGKFGPTTCSLESVMHMAFTDVSNGFALVVKSNAAYDQWIFEISHTADGTRTWHTYGTNLPAQVAYPFLGLPSLFAFVDVQHGFLWLGGPTLYTTSDGGHTWRRVLMTAPQ